MDSPHARTEPSQPPPGLAPLPAPGTRRELWLEVGVVLAIVVAPWLFVEIWSLATVGLHSSMPVAGPSLARRLFLDGPLILFVLYVVERSGRPWADFGLRRPRWISDLVLGVLLYVLAYLSRNLLAMALLTLGDPAWFGLQLRHVQLPPLTVWLKIEGVGSAMIVAGIEELVFRSYLITRLETLLGSVARAVAVTALLFGAIHAYMGVFGVARTLLTGVIYGAVFVSTRRIWPAFLAHAIGDSIGYF